MTATRTSNRADHRAALAACKWCRACTQELVTLQEQWLAQSRTIAELQRKLADARVPRASARHTVPGT